MFTKIKSSKVIFPDRTKYKIDYSDDLMNLVIGLLNKDKDERLGSKHDVEEVLGHPFFSSLDFVALKNQQLVPPFKPDVEDKDYTKFFNAEKDTSALTDTYIPRQKQKSVQQNQEAF